MQLALDHAIESINKFYLYGFSEAEWYIPSALPDLIIAIQSYASPEIIGELATFYTAFTDAESEAERREAADTLYDVFPDIIKQLEGQAQ